MKKKLKLGLLLDSFEAPEWQFRMIERIRASDAVDIALVVLDAAGPLHDSRLRKLLAKRHRIAFFLHEKLDAKLFPARPDAFAIRNMATALEGVPRLDVVPIRKRVSDRFESRDVEAIRAHDLDVILRLGFRILRGEILHAARHGVWSFHHGDNAINRGGPPGYWELVEGLPVTGSVLQVLGEELDGGKLLFRSWSTTHAVSLRRNRNNLYWKTLSFVPRKLEELHRDGPDAFFERAARFNGGVDVYSRRLHRAPGNIAATRLALRQARRAVGRGLRKAFRRLQWFLLFDMSGSDLLSLRSFRQIVPPKDRYWADPHVARSGDSHFIFVEELVYARGRAHISVIEVDSKGDRSEAVPVIDTGSHLSYPFVFEHDGRWFMIPESSASRTVELWECVEFPLKWKHVMNLMEGVDTADTTLHRLDGRWWMFSALREYPGMSHNDELFVFWSDELMTTKWTPHPLNPVISDARRARPAGPLFARGGKLFRPSQNCAHHYGYGFKLNEVTCLSDDVYEEREVVDVTPGWDPGVRGTHTFTRCGDFTVVDAYRYRWRG